MKFGVALTMLYNKGSDLQIILGWPFRRLTAGKTIREYLLHWQCLGLKNCKRTKKLKEQNYENERKSNRYGVGYRDSVQLCNRSGTDTKKQGKP
jgi:hypothetical protein